MKVDRDERQGERDRGAVEIVDERGGEQQADNRPAALAGNVRQIHSRFPGV
jgi:hypothetical protein